MQARTELVRLLNLGHLLVVTRADKEDSMFRKSRGLKTVSKHAIRSFKGALYDMVSTFLVTLKFNSLNRSKISWCCIGGKWGDQNTHFQRLLLIVAWSMMQSCLGFLCA